MPAQHAFGLGLGDPGLPPPRFEVLQDSPAVVALVRNQLGWRLGARCHACGLQGSGCRLERARERFSNDRSAVEQVNQMTRIEGEIAQSLEAGNEPPEATRAEYERTFSELQSNASYQAMVAAQSNFDRVLAKVNEEISRGIEKGSASRIILPS